MNSTHRDGNNQDATHPPDLGVKAAVQLTTDEVMTRMRQFHQVLDGMFGFVGIFSLEGVVLDANRTPFEVAGVARADVIGKPFWDTYWWCYDPQVQASLRAVMARAAAGEVVRYAPVVRMKDGLATVDAMFSPARDASGAINGIIGFGVDITERKQAEMALQKSETRFLQVLESVPDAIVMVDAQGIITLVNQQTETLLGYQRSELLGKPVEMLMAEKQRLAHVESRKQYLHDLTIRPMGKSLDLVAYRKDGRVVPVAIRLSPFETPEGTFIIASLRDITERKHLEEQLRQANKMEAIGHLAGGVAHDFNNLLGVIIGFGEIALMKLDPQSPIYGYVSDMRKAGEKAAGLTRQLLAFSRKQTLEPKVLNLKTAVSDLEKMLRRLLREDIDILLKLEPSTGCVKADPSQIEQVIVNLVVNARDAMPHGGTLIITTDNVLLDAAFVSTAPDVVPGRYVRLAIRDTGIGMTEEIKARIFEPFFTTKPVGEGTGLGLATCYGVIKQSGGHIAVETAVGMGTTFHIYLPNVADAVTEDPSVERLALGQETILLVEDDENVREMTELMLIELGYQVLTAANGEEGLRIANKHGGGIHLLLTDVIMPKLSGAKLAADLRLQYPQLKVLFISGYSTDAITHDGVLVEGAALLQKPFSSFTLARKIRDVLDSGAR